MPVFSCETYGKGRTFGMTTDTTADWGTFFERDWGENGDNRYFRKFWRNIVYWLAENSAGANRRLRVEKNAGLRALADRWREGRPGHQTSQDAVVGRSGQRLGHCGQAGTVLKHCSSKSPAAIRPMRPRP